MFSGERRKSLSWTMPGQIRTSTSLPSSPGLVSESRRSLTSGSDGWLQTTIVLHSFFLVCPFTDRGPVVALRPRMNFLMRLLVGLVTQIHGSERHGRRERDSRSSAYLVGPWLFLTVWSRSQS